MPIQNALGIPALNLSSGPALSGSGDASSGGNIVVPPDSGLNIGAVVNALSGQRESGGLPLEMPNGLGTNFSGVQRASASVNALGSSASFSLGPVLLIGGAGLAAFLFLRK